MKNTEKTLKANRNNSVEQLNNCFGKDDKGESKYPQDK